MNAQTTNSPPNLRPRVLLIEDDRSSQRLVRAFLASAHPETKIIAFSSAGPALEELRRNHYDLLICDHYLEGNQTGLDLWKEIRTFFPQLPFVLTSGRLQLSRLIQACGKGNSNLFYLTKPFLALECIELLSRLLTDSHRGGRR